MIEIACWGYPNLWRPRWRRIRDKVDFGTFFALAPGLNSNASLITGVVCGVRVEDVDIP